MIKVTNHRTRGNEAPFAPITHLKTLSNALEQILVYEFGYGGVITNMTENKLCVQTRVMNCIDNTVFEWNNSDSKVMHEVIATYAGALDAFQNEDIKNKVLGQIMEFTGGKPLTISMVAGMITGAGPVRATILTLIAGNDESSLSKLKSMKNKDLFTVFELVYLEKQKLDEVIGLLN